MDQRLNSSYWALRAGVGLAAFLAGLDKFFNLLANWEGYLSPLVTRIVPVSATTFMYAVGVIEMIVGLAILVGFERVFAYVAAAWLVGIALNLLTTGRYFDIAVRDTVMALGAYTLGRLSEVRAHAEARAPAGALRPAAGHA